MATTEWSATFETTPAGNTTRKLGDDRIRELKQAIRERLQKGGHFMQDSGAGFPKDGRHVVGVGDGPDIYKSDAVTKAVVYSDTAVTLQAGIDLVSTDGIKTLALQANAATFPRQVNANLVTVAPTTTNTSIGTVTHTLGTPKGSIAWVLSLTFEADTAANDVLDMFVEFDYLNSGVWTAFGTTGLLVPLRTAVNKGRATHTINGLNPVTTSSNGGTVPIRVKVVNNHATSNIQVITGSLLTIELRK